MLRCRMPPIEAQVGLTTGTIALKDLGLSRARCDRQVPCNNCSKRNISSICPQGVSETGPRRRWGFAVCCQVVTTDNRSRSAARNIEGETTPRMPPSQAALIERVAELESALHDLSENRGRGNHSGNPEDELSRYDDQESESAGSDRGNRRRGQSEGRLRKHTRTADSEQQSANDNRAAAELAMIAGDHSRVLVRDVSTASCTPVIVSEEHHGHLRFDSGDPRASRFFGDASSLFLIVSAS